MKVFIQVPCLNEEETLPAVLQSIPTEIEGVDEIEILVIDDGSTDRTLEVARAHGVRHFVHHTRNMGLARSFRDGVDYALSHGADIVVNTDGDNQYPQDRIGDLVQPILAGAADIVVADRQTHTMETIIQAGNKRLKIASVPVVTNPKTRESRLFKNIFHHMAKSGSAIVRSYLVYKPYVIFSTLTLLFGVLAAIPLVRFLVLWLIGGDTSGNVQSLVYGAIMSVASLLSLALGVISDLLRTNRVLLEEQLERIKEIQYRR